MASLLDSFRALDLTNNKGPFCGKILADLGADVIKVEKPGGDPARRIGPFYKNIPYPEKSLNCFAYNLNKRSITLFGHTGPYRNLERPQGHTNPLFWACGCVVELVAREAKIPLIVM